MKIPKDVQPVFGKTKFYESLDTDSLSEAKILKLSYISRWKTKIKIARTSMKPTTLDVENQVEFYRSELELYSEDTKHVGLSDLGDFLNERYLRNLDGSPLADTSKEDKAAAEEVYKRVSGDWTAVHEHLEGFLVDAEYTEQTSDEVRRTIKVFGDKFKVFEKVSQDDIEKWVLELSGTLALKTIKKRVSFIRRYWEYCNKRKLTNSSPNSVLTKRIYPDDKKTKASTARKIKKERKAFTVSDYHKLRKSSYADQALNDLIMLAAYTGCRREELCSLTLERVTHESITIDDAKTRGGWREIPLHSEIKNRVAQMVKDCADGFLLTGLDASNNKYGRRGNALGRRFLRLRDKLGYNGQYVLHSFRKTLASQMEAGEVPETHAARILGHSISTMTYGLYSEDVGFDTKVAAIEKCSYR